MPRAVLSLVALFSAVAAPDGLAQGPQLARRIFSSDSISTSAPTISPDGRWLVFTRPLSEQESRLMIAPVSGGDARDLLAVPGFHGRPLFTPAGDRLLFVSTIPRRGAADDGNYVMAAPFDSRTGSLSGAPRQVTVDGIRVGPLLAPAISPDGQWVAYVACCTGFPIRIVPVTGGNARTLAEPPEGRRPQHLSWAPDGRHLTYLVQEPPHFLRMRVSREGGAPTVMTRSTEPLGRLLPDHRYSIAVERSGSGRMGRLRLLTAAGVPVGEADVPGFQWHWPGSPSAGRYLVSSADDFVGPIRVVPIAGGPGRLVSRGESYEWPAGWSADGRQVQVQTEQQGKRAIEVLNLDGERLSIANLPDGVDWPRVFGLHDGVLYYKEAADRTPTGGRIVAHSLRDGTRRVLAQGVIGRMCCAATGPGGMYYGITRGEFFYQQVRGSRLQLIGTRVDGTSRLVAEVPVALLGKTWFQVSGDRVAYQETTGDSLRIRMMVGPRGSPRTVASFAKGASVELAWSHDGRQLAMSGGNPPSLTIFRFDAAGNPEGAPAVHLLPFSYWYETFWLPDGSGLTMIAQPKGAPRTEVALVRLADPANPILLSKDDPVSKWGHALSPDGKYVSYPVEKFRGSAIYMIEVADLVRQLGGGR